MQPQQHHGRRQQPHLAGKRLNPNAVHALTGAGASQLSWSEPACGAHVWSAAELAKPKYASPSLHGRRPRSWRVAGPPQPATCFRLGPCCSRS